MAEELKIPAVEAIFDAKSSGRSTQSNSQVPGDSEMKTQEQSDHHPHQQSHEKKMHEALRWLLQWPLIMHAALVLLFIWIMAQLGFDYPVVYVLGFIFLFLVESRHHDKMVRRIRHEERKHAAQKQLLSDFESVRWLNHTLETAWPVFLEKFASRDFLAPLMPFFIEKHKPWTVQDVSLQSFHLGRSPPFFAGLRAVDSIATDDNLVLEASMQFFGADDMSAVLNVQLKKRFGGITTKLHISKLHVEGKVRIGVRFQEGWPFVNRLRISFDGAPYLQIEARPLTNYGVDVAELPGIASWLDSMLMDALEDSLVKPNMLVINVEKLASSWGTSELTSPPVDKSLPVAYAVVEILEASQLKPADVNGLADPFVKLTLNASRCKTNIKWKTLNPTWREVFRLPVNSWEVQNRLIFQVRDKDTFRDDNLGYWDESLAKFRDGNRHESCVPLRGVKTGRLTFAITVEEVPQEDEEMSPSVFGSSTDMDESNADDSSPPPLGADQIEIIETGVGAAGIFSILRPGKSVRKQWRGRKGRRFDDKVEIPDNTLFSGSLEPDCATAAGESSGSEKENKAVRKRFWRWSNRDRARGKKGFSGELVTISDTGARVELRTVLDADTPAERVEVPLQLQREENSLTGDGTGGIEATEPLLRAGTSEVPVGASGSLPRAGESGVPAEEVASPGPLVEEDGKPGSVSVRSNDPLDDGGSDSQQVDSPGRRSMRERARSVVKQAERTASHIGHSIWKKRSGKLSPER